MGMKNYSGSFIMPVAVALLLAIAVICLAAWLIFSPAFGADNVPPCLSKAEARARWPNQIIYWHTINHCWDNVPVKVAHARKTDKLPAQDGNGNTLRKPPPLPPPKPVEQTGPVTFYPTLMSGGGTDDIMLRGETMQTWPAIVDFDVDPPAFLPWLRASALINR